MTPKSRNSSVSLSTSTKQPNSNQPNIVSKRATIPEFFSGIDEVKYAGSCREKDLPDHRISVIGTLPISVLATTGLREFS